MPYAVAGILTYLVLGVVGFVVRPGWLLGLLAVAAGAATLALWAPGFPPGLLLGETWGVAVAGDRVALVFWALALVLHLAVVLHERHRTGPFHPLLTLLVGTSLACAVSQDIFNFYVVLELVSLISFILVSYESEPKAVWASLKYLVLATAGMTFYLLGLGIVYVRTGTLGLALMAERVTQGDPVLVAGVGLLVAGLAAKSGLFVLGLWLPSAHGYAPTGVSAILSGLVVKLGVLGLARLAEVFPIEGLVLALGVVTGLGGLVYALWEWDIKLFLAHHTVSQLGYVLVGLGLGGEAAWGAVLYAAAHGLFKGLLFLSAGQAIYEVGERDLDRLRGKLSLPCALALAVGTWAIVGLPPLGGFVAKAVLADHSTAGWLAVLVVLSLGTAASFARLLPHFRSAGRGTRSRGFLLLELALLTMGVWGLVTFPGARDVGEWLKSLIVVAAGYGLHRLVHRQRVQLPALTLDRSFVLLLLGTLALVAVGLASWVLL